MAFRLNDMARVLSKPSALHSEYVNELGSEAGESARCVTLLHDRTRDGWYFRGGVVEREADGADKCLRRL